MKPAMISFMGLDGSGKSTSIDYAYEQLKERGYKVEIVRAAYVIVFLRGIVRLGKKLLMKKDSEAFLKKFDTDWVRYNRDIIRKVEDYEKSHND